ncbi:hypothetical protein FRX31_029384 [Thalictrum thalictroides]|uniref:Uncharacterized protein n=1 Tax=Thalictrum thalictroides TaxID=46969 RepID=A0A7J6V7D8_THATH|nr:hypothetical protein FRX31_029384 [Thalictrum thalictroides]
MCHLVIVFLVLTSDLDQLESCGAKRESLSYSECKFIHSQDQGIGIWLLDYLEVRLSAGFMIFFSILDLYKRKSNAD